MTSNNFWYGQLDINVGRDGSFKGAAKVVFMTLCTHASTKSRKCFLSVKTIAKESGYCERTVRSALHKLAGLGVIEITEKFSRDTGSQLSSEYKLIGNRASCYQAYGSEEIPQLLDSVMPIEEDVPPCKNLLPAPAKTYIHNESLINESKDSLTREADLPESESESKPVDKAVDLSEVPEIMKSTAQYLLLKTGRKSLTESELSSIRALSASHYPARVQKEIDTACERFRRKGQSLETLTFNYIAGSLQHQTSRGRRRTQTRKPDPLALTQAEIKAAQEKFNEEELHALEDLFVEEY